MLGLRVQVEPGGQGRRLYLDADPVCGVDRCARCGACLACAGALVCEDELGKEHVWVLTPRRQQRMLAAGLVREALQEAQYAAWVRHMLASGAQVERAGEAA
jgi:hypothetical protein